MVGEITARTPAVLSFFEGGARRYGIDTKLPSMLDFPLHRAIRSVFAQGEPMTQLVEVLAQDSLYQRPELLVPFLGNHDVPRFLSLAGGDISRLLMAQAFLLTTRGIPHLYYGDEIAVGKEEKAGGRSSVRADFPGGFPGDPVNAFTPQGRTGDAAAVFDLLRGLLHFRQARPALRRGKLVQLLVDENQYAYLRSAAGEHVLVVLNRAGAAPIDLEVDDIPLPDGLRFRSFPAGGPDLIVSGGRLRLKQPGQIHLYWTGE